ncbi:hypothetical protein FQR65_LT17253 [Abscondita terminalis]|nr:hypothetical protein FQR65_LT17253 [Abscondita terminalis]
MKNYILPAVKTQHLFDILVGIILYRNMLAKFLPTGGNAEIITYKGQKFYRNIGQEFKSPKYFHGRPSAVSYKADEATQAIKGQVRIMPSHIGWESAIGKDNYTLTRSLAAENSPYFETGVRLSYTTDNGKWYLSGLVLNGWQRIAKPEGNQSISFGHQVTYKPSEKITLNSSSFIGNDKSREEKRMRLCHPSRPFFTTYPEVQTGKFKIYIGMSAGVENIPHASGSAYLLRNGIDVKAGFIETHGREETDALAVGIPTIERRSIFYKGKYLEEMDLQAIINDHPEVVLVDELAHTNVEGSKNKKRWQDVLEILENGINVISAMNIQHIESLNEDVKNITGIESNHILQLRELALKEVATHVEKKVEAEIKTENFKPVKFLACISSNEKVAKTIIRKTARLASYYSSPWTVLYIQKPSESPEKIALDKQRYLINNFNLAQELGAKVVRMKESSVHQGILDTLTSIILPQTKIFRNPERKSNHKSDIHVLKTIGRKDYAGEKQIRSLTWTNYVTEYEKPLKEKVILLLLQLAMLPFGLSVWNVCFMIAFTPSLNLPQTIAEPIRQLTSSIRQIAGRNYHERVHFKGSEEFNDLADSFNIMAEKLEEYESSNLSKQLMDKKRIETLVNNMLRCRYWSGSKIIHLP